VKTLFEKIYDGEIPADIVHRDEICCAFRDISPQALQEKWLGILVWLKQASAP